MKPNCYECKWRGNVPGSAHSSCGHPSVSKVNENPMLGMLSILAGAGRIPGFQITDSICHIKGNPHGISHGWFSWPFNFDPIWLENCDGFEKYSEEPK